MKRTLFAAYRAVVRLFTGTRIGELPPVAFAHRLAMRWLKPPRLEIDGVELELDPGDSLGLTLSDAYEKFERRLMATLAQPGDVAVDVGANLGLYTLLLARAVGDGGRVFAFEPDPENFELLRRNLERNGARNVVAERLAVADENGPLRLYLCERNRGDHRTWDSHDGRPSIEIEAVRLDDYLDADRLGPEGRVDLVKMDVQGAEAQALAGMEGLLRRHSGVTLVTEFWPAGLVRAGAEPAAVLKRLGGLGFELYEIDEAAERVAAVTAAELLARLDPSREDHTNLLCRRGPLPAGL